jgi:hypothetical protein
MAGAFLYNNLLLTASSVQGPAAIDTLPVGNLLDPHPRRRMRSVGTNGAVLIDLGGSLPMDCWSFISTSVSANAIYRVRISSADITGLAGDVWDSGLQAASTGDEANGNVVVVRGAGTVSGRYVLMELADGSLTTVDIGVVALGALWRLTRAQAYGLTEGRVNGDRRDVNAITQAQFPVPAVFNPRFTAFGLAVMPRVDADVAREMRRLLGSVKDALWIPDLGLSQAELNNRSIWGAAFPPGEIGHVRAVFPGWNTAWRLLERG